VTEDLDVLRFVIRTPHGTVFDNAVRGVRVPTETGQVGMRPRGEPMVLAIESGLIVVRLAVETRFAATAGGLLESGRDRCVLYTPFAVIDRSEVAVLEGLGQALATPKSELAARRQLAELEQHILRELRDRNRPGHPARSQYG
jgi:F0F1-type ATP synthase epsilon subunit